MLDNMQFTSDNLAPSGQRDLLMINLALLKDVYFSVVCSANNEQLHFSKIKFGSDQSHLRVQSFQLDGGFFVFHQSNLTLCTGKRQRNSEICKGLKHIRTLARKTFMCKLFTDWLQQFILNKQSHKQHALSIVTNYKTWTDQIKGSNLQCKAQQLSIHVSACHSLLHCLSLPA